MDTLRKIALKILKTIDPVMWMTLAHDNEIKNLKNYTSQFDISSLEPTQTPAPSSFYEFNSKVLQRQFELKCQHPDKFHQQYSYNKDKVMRKIRKYIIRDICQLKHNEPEKYYSDYRCWFLSKKRTNYLLKRLNEIKKEDLDKYHHLFMKASLNGMPLLKSIQGKISSFLLRFVLNTNN